MAILVVMVFGFLSIRNINLDMMPNMDIPIAFVMTSYPGVGSAEIERLVTVPLEGVLGTVAGVSTINSSSSYGSSQITIMFEDGVDINFATLEMRERLDMIAPMLPSDASSPIVMQIDLDAANMFQMGVMAHDGNLLALRNVIENQVVNRLERIDGVAQVTIFGGIDSEIEVMLQEDALRGFGISEATVVQTLRAENASVPAGSVREGDRSMSLRISGEFNSLMDIESIPFFTPAGALIYLRDFAHVEEVLRTGNEVAFIDGLPALGIFIQPQSTANTVNVSALIVAEIERLRADFPTYEFSILMNPADFINQSIDNVVSNAMWGGIFAVLVLYLFLKSIKSTIIIAVAMPVSIVATFVLMYFTDITLNIMSLGGLALGMGMLIDNSIVVLESVFRKLEEGEPKMKAAIEGAREVAPSVTASTITTIAVFLPITFAGGLAAQLFNQLAMTIAFSLLSSLFVALTFVPMACSVILSAEEIMGNHERKFILNRWLGVLLNGVDKFIAAINRVYKRTLKFCLRRRLVTYASVFAFVVLTGASLLFTRIEFMAETDMSMVEIDVRLPRGTVVEETEEMLLEVTGRISHFEEVETLFAWVGGQGFGPAATDRGTVFVILHGVQERDRSANEIGLAMERDLQDIPGAQITASAMQFNMGGGMGGAMSLRIYGEDIEELRDIATDVMQIVEGIPGTRDVSSSVEVASPQATIRVDRQRAAAFGLSPASVSGIVNTAVTGTVATTYRIDGREMDVRVRQDSALFEHITEIQNILIPTAAGALIPLYEVAEIIVSDIPLTIQRSNMEAFVSVSSQFADENVNPAEVMNLVTAAMAEYIMPSGYRWEFTGQLQQMMEVFMDLGLALLVAILLIYMILAAEFESFTFPFIVMFSIPIALTGGILGLFILGNPFDITAFMGLIMLAGIVTNNAIVLIDYANLLVRERGMTAYDAVVRAGTVRLRPILVTAITTILALTPLLISQADGAEMMRSLATVIVFGLAFSTIVTTILIPAIYMSIEHTKERSRRRREARALRKAALR
ncbi:MAG: efflux RND transporter permease subunit [Defluviitaleaceae bacterium]|nr:efflux RND transporter permease subunit [Defluviitaleaceae bacterium]